MERRVVIHVQVRASPTVGRAPDYAGDGLTSPIPSRKSKAGDRRNAWGIPPSMQTNR
jgi:hypothetical protein